MKLLDDKIANWPAAVKPLWVEILELTLNVVDGVGDLGPILVGEPASRDAVPDERASSFILCKEKSEGC